MDDNEKRSRAIRLSTVRNLLTDNFLNEEQAKELLQGPLTPGDDSTIRDDRDLLHASVEAIMEFFGWIAKPPKS